MLRVLVARLFLLFKNYYVCLYPNEKAVPFEANLRVHDRAAGVCQSVRGLVRVHRRPLSGVKVKSRPHNQSLYSRFLSYWSGVAIFATTQYLKRR